MKKIIAIFENVKYIFKMVGRADKKRVVLSFTFSIWHMLVDLVFGSLLLRFIINCYQNSVPFYYILIILGILLIFQICYSWFSNFYNHKFLPASNEKISYYVLKRIFVNSISIELCSYDNPEFYNNYIKACDEIPRVIYVFDSCVNLLSSVFLAVSLIVVMVNINCWIVVLAFMSVIISALIWQKLNRKNYDCDMAVIAPNKKKDYVNRVFFLKEYSKEIKISNISRVLFRQLDDSIHQIIEVRKEYGKSLTFYKSILVFITDILFFFIAIIYGAFLCVVKKMILVGDFAYIVTSLSKLESAIQNIGNLINDIFRSKLYIDNLRTFIDSVPNNEKFELIDNKNNAFLLNLEHVYFQYNGNHKYILNDISFNIEMGKKIAIIGANGAGKSTLIKLLMGLYHPTQGQILFNGKPIDLYDKLEYRRLFSCVFQDFQVFGLSIGENILCREVKEEDQSNIEEALKASGLYNDLKLKGYTINSILTKEFDEKGIVLSGGQLQKLALARAFASNGKIIILDEPSSAMDPVSEFELFRDIRTISKDKTLIYITHKLATAISADEILFFENGKIIERGNHEELMCLKGKYAHMFLDQKSQYNRIEGTENEIN